MSSGIPCVKYHLWHRQLIDNMLQAPRMFMAAMK
ncbi:hypothetical protein SEEMEL47_04856 [Salmonella enterica subsp. enterica serovar Meleagridis]|nr:hypothetical protein SEEMEL47_04856 [Salmonella enterica subsp. enterica serovar Meleagridis str. 0047]